MTAKDFFKRTREAEIELKSKYLVIRIDLSVLESHQEPKKKESPSTLKKRSVNKSLRGLLN